MEDIRNTYILVRNKCRKRFDNINVNIFLFHFFNKNRNQIAYNVLIIKKVVI